MTIFTEKAKAILGTTTIILGELYVNWEECIQYPLQFLSHKAFLFPLKTSGNEKSNKLYLKIRWIPKAQYNKLTGFSANLDEKAKKNKAGWRNSLESTEEGEDEDLNEIEDTLEKKIHKEKFIIGGLLSLKTKPVQGQKLDNYKGKLKQEVPLIIEEHYETDSTNQGV